MGGRGKGRAGKGPHAATGKEDSLRTGGSTVEEESQEKEDLKADRRRYLH